MTRFVALTFMCLVVATATAQAQVNTVFTPVCTASLNTATCRFTTTMATSASMSVSTDKSYALTVLDIKPKKVHAITIRALAPATTYNIKVMATPVQGKPSVFVSSLPTGAIGSSVPATVTSANGKLLLNGVPFFPIMARAYKTCPDQQTVDNTINLLGVNVFDAQDTQAVCGGDNQDPGQWASSLHTILGNKVWWAEKNISSAQQLQDQGLQELMSWQAGTTLLYSPSQLVFENPCIAATELYKTTSRLAAGSGKASIFMTTLATHPILPSRAYCINSQNLNMLVWAFIAAGGSGIEHSTKDSGNGPDFDVDPGLASGALSLANKIKSLEPAFMAGKKLQTPVSADSPVKYGAWLYAGVVYVVAVNTDEGVINASLPLSGSLAEKASVLWEGRSLKVGKRVINDQFTSQAVHIYKILPAMTKKK